MEELEQLQIVEVDIVGKETPRDVKSTEADHITD